MRASRSSRSQKLHGNADTGLAALLKDLGVHECRDGGMAVDVFGGRIRQVLEDDAQGRKEYQKRFFV